MSRVNGRLRPFRRVMVVMRPPTWRPLVTGVGLALELGRVWFLASTRRRRRGRVRRGVTVVGTTRGGRGFRRGTDRCRGGRLRRTEIPQPVFPFQPLVPFRLLVPVLFRVFKFRLLIFRRPKRQRRSFILPMVPSPLLRVPLDDITVVVTVSDRSNRLGQVVVLVRLPFLFPLLFPAPPFRCRPGRRLAIVRRPLLQKFTRCGRR